MRVKQLVMCVPFLFSGHVLADEGEHCPNPSVIKEFTAGTYKAPTTSGSGEWYGVSQSGRGPVGEFDVAIFRPHEEVEGGAVVGEILRCGYRLQGGGALDMKFKNEGTLVRIGTNGPWAEWYNQYYCDNKEERACLFKEIVRPTRR